MAGESADLKSRQLTRAEQKHLRKAERAAQAAAAWARGAEGERRLVELLEPLTWAGSSLLADRAVPGRDTNIDAIVVGPAGVFVIDAKNWTGHLEVSGRVLKQDGARRQQVMEQVRGQMATVVELLDRAKPTSGDVPVRPVVCFVGDAHIGPRVAVDRVHLVDGAELVPFISGEAEVLDEAEVAAVTAALEEGLPARAATAALHEGEVREPEEPVVFLTPWKRYGFDRLYVIDELGEEGGFLDLQAGAAHATSESATSVLEQLAPHYAAGEGSGESAAAAEPKGGLKRLLGSRSKAEEPAGPALVVGRQWQSYERKRLYVHRVVGAAKVDLGWFDLTDGRVHADMKGMEPVIRFCGRTYLRVARSASSS